MGVYSSNRTQLGMYNSDEIIANESYIGVAGAFQMMVEGFQNDQAIFESVLANDFAEAIAVQEGTGVEVVNEASVGGFIEKMKELVKKAWEKIKGLFQTFLAKFNNVIIRDNKKFVDKYKKEVLTKNLSKMKYKWAAPKEGELDALEKLVGSAQARVDELMSGCMSGNNKDINEKVDSGDFLEDLLGCEPKEFNKEAHESCFGDLDEVEGLDSSRLTYCMNVLLGSAKTIKRVEKAKSDADKVYSTMLKQIDKAKNAVAKNFPKDDQTSVKISDDHGTISGKSTDVMSKLNTMTKVINVGNTAMSRISGVLIAETKFEIKQARRVFAQAAAFNAKAVKENALLVEAAGDAAEYEVESSFNDYEM